MENRKIKIYVLEKNKIPFYVGKTINALNRRLSNHKKTFGSNVSIVLIDECTIHDWRFWEEYYISLFKSWGFILENKNNGGCGPVYYSLEERIKFKKPKLNKVNYSKPHFKIKVYQYDLEGNFIKEWNSIIEAANHFNRNHGMDIINCCRGKQKTAYNFIWRKNQEKININELNLGKRKRNIILQYDLKGNFIKEWNTITEASLFLKVSGVSITHNLKGKQKTAYGFKWKYKKENSI
jgi:hypothetical protein